MKYLILSKGGYGLFIVPRLEQASDTEAVYFYCAEPKLSTMGEGMDQVEGWEKFEMVSDFNKVLNSTPKSNLIIVLDDVGLGETATHLINDGYKVVGGAAFCDKIEDDRVFGMKFASKLLLVPQFSSYTSFADGIMFLKGQPKEARFVFKPNDAMVPKEYTFVGRDVPSLIEAMSTFKDEWAWKEDYILQEFIDGVEVDFSAWFNGKTYLPNSMAIYFENKPFMTGDIGAATGGSVAVQFNREVKGIFGDILLKAVPYLAASGYRGQLSINCKIDKSGKPFFIEFTPRFGYPSLPMDITLLEDSGHNFATLIKALANGESPNLFPTKKVAVVLEISTPPYPNEDHMHQTKNLPVYWSKKWDVYFFPYFIKYLAKKKTLGLSGYSGMVAHVTCSDQTLEGAVAMLYTDYVKSVRVKNLQYRTDLGRSAKERIKSLRELRII